MEVDQFNYDRVKGFIKDCISSADFISFDQEFSGLPKICTSSASNLTEGYEKYWRARKDIQKLSVLQFGLCTFKLDKNRWNIHPFLFYVLPRPPARAQRELIFNISSAEFLSRNNFDFNRLFQNGIPYMNKSEEIEGQILESKFGGNNSKFSSFSEIIQHLCQMKKPVVGHNIFLDLLFMVDKFIDFLPETFPSFAEIIRRSFSKLYDTKVMANSSCFTFSNTSLHTIYYEFTCQFPVPDYFIDSQFDITSLSYPHNAVYDAFVTGILFTMLWDKLSLQPEFIREVMDDTYNFKFFMASNGPASVVKLSAEKSFSSNDKSNIAVLLTSGYFTDEDVIKIFAKYAPVCVYWAEENTLVFVRLKGNQINWKIVINSLSLDSSVLAIPYCKYRAIWRRKVPHDNESICEFVLRSIREHKDFKEVGPL